ncbi:MAG: Kdo hydroxylase family protein [Betaproteobacteria bacterium]|nr:Kdo hydroxylase family protein [Betaproteobacteria bacterium]
MESSILELVSPTNWDPIVNAIESADATQALERGRILLFKFLGFSLTPREQRFLSPECADPRAKNISYDSGTDKVRGTTVQGGDREDLTAMMRRFAAQALNFVNQLLPIYAEHLEMGRTSYRPVEILGRTTSATKNDTRLHVDAFASSPVQRRRILRLFTNVNPRGEPRVWQVGEPFEQFAPRLLPDIGLPRPIAPWLLKQLRITKSLRTPYDHVMLNLHDRVKLDTGYQRNAPREQVNFPPGSTWIVFTDRVLHAALGGQYLLEQTFYLPVHAMADERISPLRILESHYGRPLA